jgi:hypothetical protein
VGVAATRHLIGYLCCLAFVTLVLTFFGFFPGVVRNVEANAGGFLDGFSSDPTFGPAVRYTPSVFGTPFSPALALGHFIAIVISPIGLVTLLVYVLIAWMLPAR